MLANFFIRIMSRGKFNVIFCFLPNLLKRLVPLRFSVIFHFFTEKFLFLWGEFPGMFFNCLVTLHKVNSCNCSIRMPTCVKINPGIILVSGISPKVPVYIKPEFICSFNKTFVKIYFKVTKAINRLFCNIKVPFLHKISSIFSSIGLSFWEVTEFLFFKLFSNSFRIPKTAIKFHLPFLPVTAYFIACSTSET